MPPNLRSRQIPPPKSTSSPRRTPNKSASTTKTSKKNQSPIGPITPNPTHEASVLPQELTPDSLPPQTGSVTNSGPRRSLRLSGKSNCGSNDLLSPATKRRKRLKSTESQLGKETPAMASTVTEVIWVSDSDSNSDEKNDADIMDLQLQLGSEGDKKGSKRKLSDWLDMGTGLESEDPYDMEFLSLGLSNTSAKGILGDGNRDEFVSSVVAASPGTYVGEGSNVEGTKGKEVVIEIDQEGEDSDYSLGTEMGSMLRKRKYSRDEKGKGKLVFDDYQLLKQAFVDLKLKLGNVNVDVPEPPELTVNQPSPVWDNTGSSACNVNPPSPPPAPVQDDNLQQPPPDNAQGSQSANDRAREYRVRQFREIAKETASRFARVIPTHVPSESDEEGEEVPSGQDAAQNLEEWPGPFSTAMKIIRDREKKNNTQQTFVTNKSGSSSVLWKPRTESVCLKERVAPSLQDLCLNVLAKNGDAIPSLEYVPDALRNKLSRMICDSRKMSGHVLDLLFEGSPTEIRVADCSWITEEQFAKSFESCDTSNLMVLDLNQCGRCIPDYTVNETLARKGLPVLLIMSLKGACRLSDIGLTELVLKAPSLRSLNLSQCSLLTDVGIHAIAESLGSVLRELYLDDCQSLNSMLILPALQKMSNLKVLSLAGIPSVSNVFVKELVKSNGQALKELILADCSKLTDKSLKVIGETCSGLRALDLQNVCKLSDYGIGYITNGCPEIQKLKLCRQVFSDEAVAAFVETRGKSLRELSLNSVFKVGAHTAISIGRSCKNLLWLDVSWCRDLTDEHLGMIADGCLSLRVMKAFGCQMTDVFLDGHSNPELHVIGTKLTPILEHMRLEDLMPGH